MKQGTKHNSTVQVLALCRFGGVKPRLLQALLHHFGNLDRILSADSGKLMAIDGMTAQAANLIIKSSKSFGAAEEYHASLKERDIAIVTLLDDAYPDLLSELNDPPPLLYVRGRLPDRTRKSTAIIGTSEATNAGIELTVKVAGRFAAAQVQVISSMNRGIDAATHIGSKSASGVSFSVLESGLDHVEPPENVPLAIDIAREGGVITEYPPEQESREDGYKSSNRLIVGMAQAVVVTELYRDSRRAHDLLDCCNQIGKLVFLVIDPRHGALADEESLNKAASCGAIPMVGLEKVDDIVRALV
jgi:DNA processing protein